MKFKSLRNLYIYGITYVYVNIYVSYLQILFRKYGWNKETFYFPYYRQVQKRSNMDNYSSKGSTVRPQKKMHHASLQLTAVGGPDDGN